MTLVARSGVIQSHRGPDTLTIRFTSGVIWDGVAYGPRHRDEPVAMPAHQARHFLHLGKAVLYVPPAAPETSDTNDEDPTEPAVPPPQRRRRKSDGAA